MNFKDTLLNPNIHIHNSLFRTFCNKNCLFIHIPKTAGLSIRKALLNDNGSYHYSMIDYENIFTKRFINKAFKFAIVRHPIYRAISAYNYLYEGGINIVDEEFSNKYIKCYNDFNDFVNNGLVKSSQIQNFIHFKTQKSFLVNNQGDIDIDYIGKLEMIENDYIHISKKLKVGSELPVINKTKIKTDNLELSQLTIMNLFSIYEDDYKLLNYSFDE